MKIDLTFSEILALIENASVGAVAAGAIASTATPSGSTSNAGRSPRKKAKKGDVKPVMIYR